MKKIVVEEGVDRNGKYSSGAYMENGHYVQITIDRRGIHVRIDMLILGTFQTQEEAMTFIRIHTESPL